MPPKQTQRVIAVESSRYRASIRLSSVAGHLCNAIVSSRPTMVNLHAPMNAGLSLLIDWRNECHDKD